MSATSGTSLSISESTLCSEVAIGIGTFRMVSRRPGLPGTVPVSSIHILSPNIYLLNRTAPILGNCFGFVAVLGSLVYLSYDWNTSGNPILSEPSVFVGANPFRVHIIVIEHYRYNTYLYLRSISMVHILKYNTEPIIFDILD